jgi:hypothetical protein
MLKLIQLNGRQLETNALSQDLTLSVRNTEDYLTSRAAKISLQADQSVTADHPLTVRVLVKNLAGHKLPTAYPSRRVWIHLAVKDGSGELVFESGAPLDDGSIEHNDNDKNAASYEPHYTTIESAEQVQIYESIMKTPQGEVTTGLLSAIGYHKDNRLLPNGFDKASADPDIAVRGRALNDETFVAAKDEIIYTVKTKGRKAPFTVVARLLYQPVGFRWAKNLDEYDSAESRRFIDMFNGISKRETIVTLSKTSKTIQPGDEIAPIDAGSISESAAAPQ